jgi:two-component system, NarL family, response regulator NreC
MRGITDRFDTLSEREREVFQLLVEGHTNKSMAEVLGVSPATVETHRGHILEKLGLHSAADVVRYAARRGLVR